MSYGQHKLRESKIEKDVKKYATSRGWTVRKFKSPGHKSVPDQIFLRHPGHVFFIEFKAPNKEPDSKQLLEHGELRHQGFKVYVVDNIGNGYNIVDRETDKCGTSTS